MAKDEFYPLKDVCQYGECRNRYNAIVRKDGGDVETVLYVCRPCADYMMQHEGWKEFYT